MQLNQRLTMLVASVCMTARQASAGTSHSRNSPSLARDASRFGCPLQLLRWTTSFP